MEDYYREVLGTPKSGIWKSGSKLFYEYGKLNTYPNIRLNDAERKIFSGDIEKAETLLNEVKIDLSDFGTNWFISAIYHPFERGKKLRLGPDSSYEFPFDEYLFRSFYNANFMRMRKKQLEGEPYEAKTIRNNLLDEEFFRNFSDTAKIYIEEKENRKTVKGLHNPKDMIFWLAEIPKNTASLFLLAFPLSYMALTGGGCPYQRSRFYSAMIEEKEGIRGLDNELLSSDFHKKLFLPNFGMDGCTQKELYVFNNLKNDEKEFRRAAKKWNSKLVQI